MAYSIPSLDKLVEQFERLPGIGKKTARRLAYFVVTRQDGMAQKFSEALLEAKAKIKYCSVCQNLTDGEICSICSAPERDRSVICVVEDAQDVMAFERTREYRGLYHVLHGAISPMDGIGPDDINLKQLIIRLQNSDVKEVILATNPTIEGEATAMYAARLIKPSGIRVTRIAHGIPVGGDLEYTDEVTLSKAMDGRRDL